MGDKHTHTPQYYSVVHQVHSVHLPHNTAVDSSAPINQHTSQTLCHLIVLQTKCPLTIHHNIYDCKQPLQKNVDVQIVHFPR
jgi:hypothetical protein